MLYTIIRSKFIKKEIKKIEQQDDGYIDDLMYIERFASGKFFGMEDACIIKKLESKYPKQWKKIWMEINPEGYKEMIEKKKRN